MRNKKKKKEYEPPQILTEYVELESGIAAGSYVKPSGEQIDLPNVETWEDNTDNATLWI